MQNKILRVNSQIQTSLKEGLQKQLNKGKADFLNIQTLSVSTSGGAHPYILFMHYHSSFFIGSTL
jgi:hypothetical protein